MDYGLLYRQLAYKSYGCMTVAYLGFYEGGLSTEGARFEALEAPWGV